MNLLLLLTLVSAAPKTGPAFIEDDYARALTKAKKEGKLLFVDAWAAWCHSCVAMKEQVFTRESFKAFEKDVVFASIDTEKAKSAKFLERFPIEVWPTLLFIDPAQEKVVLKWLGSADEAQMTALLTAARGGDAALKEADSLYASGDAQLAAEKFEAAVRAGKNDSRTLLSMLAALYSSKQHEVCSRAVVEQLGALSAPQDRVVALSYGLWCALEQPQSKARTLALDQLVPEAGKLLPAAVLADDVSGLYEALVEERARAGDEPGAKALGKQWLTFLNEQAAKAKSPAERAVFDAHRTQAAIRAGEPAFMLEPLARSEKELPSDYNPPARLALIHRELGQHKEALAAVERALKKCKEGPRRLRLYDVKAGLQQKAGDEKGAKATRVDALKYAKKLPKSQISEKRLAAIEAASR